MKEILKNLMDGHPAQPDHVSQMVDALMAGHLDPAVAGSFLTLQLRNGISGSQLKAALDTMLKFATTIEIADPNAVDNCGTGGDGGNYFNISTTSAFVVAGAGHTMAKHGNRAVSSSCGSADILEALGIRLDLKPEQVRACIDEVGIGFMFAPVFHPAVRHAVPIRKALGVRTMFNMLGPLANPANVNHQLIGVFDESLTEVFGEALAELGKTAYVVFGEDGADEVSIVTRTKVTEVRDGQFHSFIFDPRRYGFDLAEEAAVAGGDLETNRGLLEAVLRDRQKSAARDVVILNAGFCMHTTGAYKDLEEAFVKAAEVIDSGAAWDKLQALAEWTQKQT